MSVIDSLLRLLDLDSPHPNFRMASGGSLREKQSCDGSLAMRHLAFQPMLPHRL